MPSRASAGAAVYMAYNTSTNAYATGDVGNHTIRFVRDFTEATPTNSPAEIDSTNAPGAYAIAWTSAEGTCNVLWIGGKSATASVIIVPIAVGFENLPVLPTPLLAAGSGVNLSQWLGVAPNALQGGLVQAATLSGLVNANLTLWQGTAPNGLQSGLVQVATLSGAAAGVLTTVTANVTSIAGLATATSFALGNVNLATWEGVGPNVLQNGLVQVAQVSGATTSVVGAVGSVTARVTANADQIAGATVNALISGRVDAIANQLGASIIQASTFNAGALTTTVFAQPFLISTSFDATYSNALADALLDRANAIETAVTPRQAWRLVAAAEGGVLSGAGTTSINILGAKVATNRITATTDQSGNRLAVTLNI